MAFEHMQLHDPAARARWAAELGVDEATLAAAVRAVGDELDNVKAWLASPSRGAAQRQGDAGAGPGER